MEIERGEAEAIILAKKINADMLILDEKIPREIAGAIGLKVVGSLALIHEERVNKPNAGRGYKEDEGKENMDQ